jgi:leucine-zipper of insertion element IS481
MSHANACLTPRGRSRLASAIVDDGWTMTRAAERFQCSTATAKKWADRYRDSGEAGMQDRSSRPHRSPRRLSQRRERRIIKLRFTRRWGPHRIASHLHLPRSTVEAVLRRYRMPLLRHLDQTSGLPVRRTRPRRYEHPAPGDLVHVDIKEAGPYPRRWRTSQTGPNRGQPQQQKTQPRICVLTSRGRRPLPAGLFGDPRRGVQGDRRSVLGSRSRLLRRTWRHGPAVLSDNGSCYRSKLSRQRSAPALLTRRPAPTVRRPTGR